MSLLFPVAIFLGLFASTDKETTILRNVRNYTSFDTASHPKKALKLLIFTLLEKVHSFLVYGRHV